MIAAEANNKLTDAVIDENQEKRIENEEDATLRIDVALNGLNILFRAVTVEVKLHAIMHEYLTEFKGDPRI